MPLPSALQAKLAKRGLLRASSAAREPEEEIIAEDYDDQMQVDGDGKNTQEKLNVPDEVPVCPNKYNIYHTCQSFCSQYWGKGITRPTPENEKKRKGMLKKYPLSSKWEEVYDLGTGRYYYWNRDTNEVSWLAPKHPKARISPCANKMRRTVMEAELLKKKTPAISDGESNDSESSEEEEKPKKVPEKIHKKERNYSKGRKKHKDNDLDPMDPASYSDVPRGSWTSGLEMKGEAKTGVDSTASGPLFQMRPYPSPGAVLRANASAQK